MNELVELLQQKTGMSQEMAQQVVNIVASHLKSKLPAPMAAGLENLLGGAGSQQSGDGGGMMQRAESMLEGMSGIGGNAGAGGPRGNEGS
jgi:hypothetical protein